MEPPHDLARQLEVRQLIFPDRDDVRLVEEDVGCLQDGAKNARAVAQKTITEVKSAFGLAASRVRELTGKPANRLTG